MYRILINIKRLHNCIFIEKIEHSYNIYILHNKLLNKLDMHLLLGRLKI